MKNIKIVGLLYFIFLVSCLFHNEKETSPYEMFDSIDYGNVSFDLTGTIINDSSFQLGAKFVEPNLSIYLNDKKLISNPKNQELYSEIMAISELNGGFDLFVVINDEIIYKQYFVLPLQEFVKTTFLDTTFYGDDGISHSIPLNFKILKSDSYQQRNYAYYNQIFERSNGSSSGNPWNSEFDWPIWTPTYVNGAVDTTHILSLGINVTSFSAGCESSVYVINDQLKGQYFTYLIKSRKKYKYRDPL